jgi:aryl-alcohol dehydrogenase-like predicted oxidoreductase
VLSSKCFWPMGADVNRRGGSRRWIVRACEESLTRLGTDRIDVFYLHKPDLSTDLAESLAALDVLVRSGKVRVAAMSTFPADLLVEAHWAAERHGLVAPRVEQPPYSIVARGIERDVLPVCRAHGMGVLVWGPLNGGWLSGAYGDSTGDAPEGSRAQRWKARSGRGWDDSRAEVRTKRAVVAALGELADQAGMPLSHLALAFSHTHPAVTAAIIGPRTMAQLDDMLAAADVRLSPEVLDAIDEIVAPGSDVDPECDRGWHAPWLSDAKLRRR